VNRFIREAKRAGASEVWVLTNESNRAAMAMYARSGLKRASSDDAVLVLDFRASSKPKKSR
jgi:ribosomal protein S18 acetylase RimI-like enzyme